MKKLFSISALGALATMVAGALHLGVEVPSHASLLPHVLLFGVGGGVQIFLGWRWWQGAPKPSLLATVNGGLAFLWLITRFFLPPFVSAAEPISLIGGILFGLEIFALLALVPRKRQMVTGIIAALALYGFGMIGQQAFPQFVQTVSQGHHAH
ncbi:MAG: hypothetical protein K9M51_03785 [Candidatus Gracilibacteria bacterium]|nr:hypothetical protein [Candidatus Gracilibacteria bacterium]